MAQKYLRVIKELGKNRVRQNEALAKHTTFNIGGPADLFYEAKNTDELVKAVMSSRQYKVPYFVIGGGSNILVSDEGFRGIVIHNRTSFLQIRDCAQNLGSFDHKDSSAITSSVLLEAESGVLLSNLLSYTYKNGLSGFEFLAGIPGTVGGAIRGNAGTVDKWINKVIRKVTILNKSNKIQDLLTNQCNFAYRSSRFKKTEEVILKTEFVLKKDKKLAIEARKRTFLRRRRNQPKEPSAGSIFKNPPNRSAGKLIDGCGLKGKRIGDAQISPKHANFIVNLGKAKADDVIQLIKLVKNEVKKKFGIELEEEIYLLGFDKI